jgi:hypothetical protein
MLSMHLLEKFAVFRRFAENCTGVRRSWRANWLA